MKNVKERLITAPEIFFLSGTIVFGLLFVILIPPFQIPDELIHFTRAYEVSELRVPQKHEVNDVNHLGSMLPKSILKTYKSTSLYQIPGYPDVPPAKKYSIHDTKVALKIPLNKSDRMFFDTGSSPAYFPLLYIPQAVTIAILQLFNTPVIVLLYATRVTGLVVWMLLICLAFKFVRPVGRKLPLAAILLLPMFISQASASTDPLINGLTVVYLAMISNFIIRKVRPQPVHIAALVAILSLTTLSKPVYVLFGLLLFLLPKFLVGWKTILRSTLLFSIPFIIYALWGGATKVSGAYFFDAIAVSGADPSSQVHYLISNVTNFVQPLTNTLLLNWGDGIFTSLIGMFGKLDTPLPLLFIVLGYVIVFVALMGGVADKKAQKNDQEVIRHNVKSVVISILLVLGYIFGVYLAMYIASTPPQEKIITGVQGRYLLPLIPFGVLFAAKSCFVFRKRSSYEIFLLVAPMILLLASVIVVFLRYYVKYP